MARELKARIATFRRRRGVSLIELMIALAITAVLLTAVAAAFDAGFDSYKENQQLADAVQSGRILIHRITSQARNSTYLRVNSTGHLIQVEVVGDDWQYNYLYLPDSDAVYLARMNLDTLTWETMGTVQNVTTWSIPTSQWKTNPDRLTLSLTVSQGGNTASLTGSATPRQTIAF